MRYSSDGTTPRKAPSTLSRLGEGRERRPAASLVMIGSSNPTNRARLNSLMEKTRPGRQRGESRHGRRPAEGPADQGSKICLFPSYVDEWGIVPQEALACGLPVVAYDLPVYQENIKGCPSVFLEPRGDLEQWPRWPPACSKAILTWSTRGTGRVCKTVRLGRGCPRRIRHPALGDR